jgi:hypothetical protein
MTARRRFLKRAASGLVVLGSSRFNARAASLGPMMGSDRSVIDKPSPMIGLKPLRLPANRSSATDSVPPPNNVPPNEPDPATTPTTPPTAPQGLASAVLKDADLRDHPDVLAYIEFKDDATVLADLGSSNWSDSAHRAWYAISTLPDGKSFPVSDPEYALYRGLPFMRFSGGNVNNRLIAAHLFAGEGVRHAFCRYVLVIEPDVPLYITDGVKLPGFAGEYEDTVLHPPHAGSVTFSWRMEHGPKETLSVRDYLYDGTTGSGFGNILEYGRAFPVGVPITIEQELDVDAKKGRVWIDGEMIGERNVVTDVDIEMLFLNIYHGGTRKSTQPVHYRLAAACIATSYIGVPLELQGDTGDVAPAPAPPSPGSAAWRKGLPIGHWVEIPGTSLSKLGVPSGNIDAWCGLAAIDEASLWVSAAGGGHSDSNDNGVYGINWMSDAPKWYTMCLPSSTADRVQAKQSGAGMPGVPYAADGKPNSCHTYWSLVWCAQQRRVIRPFSAALWYAAQSAPNMDGFDPIENDWDSPGTFPNSPIGGTQALVATDPSTGDIYVSDVANSWARWTQATNNWERFTLSGRFGYGGYHGAVVDAKRNRLVRAGTTSNGDHLSQIPFFDLSTRVAQMVPSGIADPPLGARTIVHDTRNDAYYLTDSVNVYKIDPDTLAGAFLGPLPLPARNGAYSRFAYFASLGGIAYYPSFADNVWFMATE